VVVGVFPRWALKEVLRCPAWVRIRGYEITPSCRQFSTANSLVFILEFALMFIVSMVVVAGLSIAISNLGKGWSYGHR